MRRGIVVVVVAIVLALPAAAAGQTATPICSPAPANCSGWYAANVALDWDTDAVIEDEGCIKDLFELDGVYQRRCRVRNSSSEPWRPFDVTIRVDKTAPVVAGVAPSRGADSNGWYRSPVDITFFGTDETSGIESCSSGTYSGPDASSASVIGRCWDRAGNLSAPSEFGLRYDSTPPAVTNLDADGGDESVRLRWAVSGATQAEVWRSPGRAGAARSVVSRGANGTVLDRNLRNGRRYDYNLVALDDAGNITTRSFSATPGRRLLSPADGATVDGPPMLRWTDVHGAGYYNVQLLRNGRKVLSAWPSSAHFKLDRAWRFNGHRFRLKPGRRYTWLVWPGRGKRARNDYGPLIGRGTFTVAAA